MEALFLKLLNMSITASWLVLAIIAVRLIFKKTPKWITCLLWGLVAFRLICPFSIESSLSLIPNPEPLSLETAYTSESVKQAHGEILDSEGNVIVERHPAANGDILDSEGNVIVEIQDGIRTYPEKKQPHGWMYFLSRIWLVGIGVMLAYTAVSCYLLKQKVATAIPLKRGIKQSDYVDSPFVLGIFRPVIYLPFGMPEGDMIYVIAHEKAHICRRDHWWKPFGFLLLSVYWFNPLLWVAYILLCRDIEAACDEKVIREMDKDGRRAYSTALLNCSVHRRRIAACPLAFGEVGVKARVKGVMNYKKPAFWVILIALIVSLIVAVCFLTNPKSTLPIKMSAMYVNRTGADLKFYYDETPAEVEYTISECYNLESLVDGNWQELSKLTDGEPSEQVIDVTSTDSDFDAWSLLKWEEHYGRLPDGSYRITKEITIHSDSVKSETYPVYIEFTIGGTAEEYVTYTLEDITPTGANLYEHETVADEFQLIYEGSEGFWLESWQDGQWNYVEPSGYIEPIFENEKRYIHALHHPSSHIELDWSYLYGELPDGKYRIAREVTNTTAEDLRVCTAYAEFTIDANWGIDLLVDKLSENRLTVSFLMGDDISEGEYFHAGATLQLQEHMGNWTDIIPLPKEIRIREDPISDMSEMSLIWDADLHKLAERQYRVGIRIQRVLPSGKKEIKTVYEYFNPAEYAWGASLRISEITQDEYGLRLTVEHNCSKQIPEGSLTMSHDFRLERRANNQWEDMGEPQLDIPDTQHPVVFGEHYETEYIRISDYYDMLSNGTYRLVKDVTRYYLDGSSETHPVYAVFAVDNNIEKAVT